MILGQIELFPKNHFFWPLGGENTQKMWKNRIFQKIAPHHLRVISTIKTTISNFLDVKNENFGKKYPYKQFLGDFGQYKIGSGLAQGQIREN